MKWYLIISFLISTECPRYTEEPITFTTKARCERAGLMIYGSEAKLKKRNMEWFCLEK